ncbi:imelysin family protein [Roseovarius sp. C7]|uniref:imelysin family protein n=1 Tax=Roseovarius sp. C7 TaxID=3398643 RepID=UPI0039F6D1F5
MKHWLVQIAIALALPSMAMAEVANLDRVVKEHILPGYHALRESTADLAETAEADCAPDSKALRTAYGRAFDAWLRVSHLRFGPSETEGRAFSLAFWPDPRGKTSKALARLIAEQDPVAESAESYAEVLIAARGFYALEFLLYDPAYGAGLPEGQAAYRCQLIRAMTADMAATAEAILRDWQEGYGAALSRPGTTDIYRSEEEAAQQVLTALDGGLEFTAAMRLGRPMGDIDRPRPNRAEARRSGRSLRHVKLSLDAMRELTALLAQGAPGVAEALDRDFARALERVETLDDPVLAGVATPQGRLHLEVLQQSVETIRDRLAQELGPQLGIAAGFNALDGD